MDQIRTCLVQLHLILFFTIADSQWVLIVVSIFNKLDVT
jgi:hypothetical protein